MSGQVVALEKAVFLGLGAGEEVNVEAREVNAGGSRYYGGFPLRRDSINGAHLGNYGERQ